PDALQARVARKLVQKCTRPSLARSTSRGKTENATIAPAPNRTANEPSGATDPCGGAGTADGCGTVFDAVAADTGVVCCDATCGAGRGAELSTRKYIPAATARAAATQMEGLFMNEVLSFSYAPFEATFSLEPKILHDFRLSQVLTAAACGPSQSAYIL